MPELLFDTCVLSDFALSASLPLLEVLCSQSAVITDLVAIASRRDCVFARGDRAAHKEATLARGQADQGYRHSDQADNSGITLKQSNVLLKKMIQSDSDPRAEGITTEMREQQAYGY